MSLYTSFDLGKDRRRMPLAKLWHSHNGVVTEVTDRDSLLNHLILLEDDNYLLARNWINAVRKFKNRACTK